MGEVTNVVDLLAPRKRGEHVWLRYDEDHRGCQACGLRLFRDGRQWIMVDYWGVPHGNLLSDGTGSFGACNPPNVRALAVLIDYTGDPDRHYGCERFMHRILTPPVMAPGQSEGLVLLSSVRPACGYQPRWWEVGPARDHVGWTWCYDCFPETAGAARRDGALQLEAPKTEALARVPKARTARARKEPLPKYSTDPPQLGPGGSTRRRR